MRRRLSATSPLSALIDSIDQVRADGRTVDLECAGDTQTFTFDCAVDADGTQADVYATLRIAAPIDRSVFVRFGQRQRQRHSRVGTARCRYDSAVRAVVDDVMAGFNGTVFAYVCPAGCRWNHTACNSTEWSLRAHQWRLLFARVLCANRTYQPRAHAAASCCRALRQLSVGSDRLSYYGNGGFACLPHELLLRRLVH